MMGVMLSPAVAAMEVRVQPREDFAAWMAVEQRRVFLLCFRLLGERDEADTAAQEVFLKAYQAINRQDGMPVEDPTRWLTRIAVNTCLDKLRSRRWRFWHRRPNPDEEQAVLASVISGAPNAEDRVFAQEIAARLRLALDKLSLRQRAVFVLRHYEDRSLEEIAALLKLDVGTVKAHMSRALAKLRLELRDLYGRQPLERR
jgi:RNA polymerase sigma-70 factor (ECF subfamily)